jgi:hypothetical protein
MENTAAAYRTEAKQEMRPAKTKQWQTSDEGTEAAVHEYAIKTGNLPPKRSWAAEMKHEHSCSRKNCAKDCATGTSTSGVLLGPKHVAESETGAGLCSAQSKRPAGKEISWHAPSAGVRIGPWQRFPRDDWRQKIGPRSGASPALTRRQNGRPKPARTSVGGSREKGIGFPANRKTEDSDRNKLQRAGGSEAGKLRSYGTAQPKHKTKWGMKPTNEDQ